MNKMYKIPSFGIILSCRKRKLKQPAPSEEDSEHLKPFRYLFCVLLITWPCIAVPSASATKSSWTEPIKGEITDKFGTRGGKHKGLDIAAPEGEMVVAAADGTVSKSYASNSYGQVIFIKHDNGYETVYAHLNKRLKKKGDRVKKGEEIGIIGNTGISTGTHLHFEIHQGAWTENKKNAINPLTVYSEEAFRPSSVHVNKGSAETKSEITVRKGDTLWKISRENGLSVEKMMEMNGLANPNIYAGQTLRLDESREKQRTYIVQKGDTLYRIAEKMGVTAGAIQEWNGLKGETIYPQQPLLIRVDRSS
ncbi:peptidoglycan hydrolase YocH [Bacillus glycinifermentans]|nr:peptidoglycan hydrolase YocH [Bacillus glycinifermentans]